MMDCDPAHARRRRLGVAALAGLVIACAGVPALAEDGVPDFLSAIFGHAPAAPQPAVPATAEGSNAPGTRPLTVKLHRRKAVVMLPIPTKPGKVSIFEDKTLRPGDAVMTRRGMRVFAGSNSWPYRDDDFVAITEAGRMDKGVQKTLIGLDRLPRN